MLRGCHESTFFGLPVLLSAHSLPSLPFLCILGRMIILERCRHFLLQSSYSLGIGRMVAEDVIMVGTVALRHTFPERNGLLRIVACHGSKDKSHIVGLSLIVARILQVAEREILSSHGTRQIAYTAAYSLIEHIAQDVGTPVGFAAW